jgi:hypothetical protein
LEKKRLQEEKQQQSAQSKFIKQAASNAKPFLSQRTKYVDHFKFKLAPVRLSDNPPATHATKSRVGKVILLPYINDDGHEVMGTAIIGTACGSSLTMTERNVCYWLDELDAAATDTPMYGMNCGCQDRLILPVEEERTYIPAEVDMSNGVVKLLALNEAEPAETPVYRGTFSDGKWWRGELPV